MTLTEISAGLVASLVSTTAMSLMEYPIWRRRGMEGVSEWHLNQTLKGWAIRFQSEYLMRRTFFDPFPVDLIEWSDAGRPIEL